jgi:hypothetical protein
LNFSSMLSARGSIAESRELMVGNGRDVRATVERAGSRERRRANRLRPWMYVCNECRARDRVLSACPL